MTNQTNLENKKIDTDVCVIGAGPAGLFSVFECGMLKMSCHVIDWYQDLGTAEMR